MLLTSATGDCLAQGLVANGEVVVLTGAGQLEISDDQRDGAYGPIGFDDHPAVVASALVLSRVVWTLYVKHFLG